MDDPAGTSFRPLQPRRPEDFDAAYASTPPWDIGRPQPALEQLVDAGLVTGRILDVGCGTGEHALMAAARGLPALGIDTSGAAVAIAEEKARDRGLSARFLVLNALSVVDLGEHFDTVIDSGFFHVLEDEDRLVFEQGMRRVVDPGGHYLMLCFSDQQPGTQGPRRVTQDEIRSCFHSGWEVDRIEGVAMELTRIPHGARAWLATITRS